MKKKTVILSLSLFICFVGLMMIFNATTLGCNYANRALSSAGGMDTEQFYFLMKSGAVSFQLGGVVTALLGGTAAMIFGSKTEAEAKSSDTESTEEQQ